MELVKYAKWLVLIECVVGVSRDRNMTVAWHAPFFSGGGYCSEASSFVVALDHVGIDVHIEHHGDSFSESYVRGQADSSIFAKVSTLARKRRSKRGFDAVVCHSEPGAWHVLEGPMWPSSPCPTKGRDTIVVGRTMFETDRLPEGWPRRLNAVDEVWVPTDFHRRIFEASGVQRVHVIGEPVDINAFAPGGPTLELPDIEPDAFVAASVFKWEKRKGWDVMLAAWREACHTRDTLVLVTNAYHSESDFEAMLDAHVRKDLAEPLGLSALCRIKVLSGLSHADLASLYRRADVLLAPTRGEGWGRPHVEAMASATPVIATNWSGPTAYLTEYNGGPLSYRLVPVGEGPFKDHVWAEPDLSHLVDLIRQARDNRTLWRNKGKRARADMVERFSPAVLAVAVKSRLEDLLLHRQSSEPKRNRDAASSPHAGYTDL